jgi:hypothetical protein
MSGLDRVGQNYYGRVVTLTDSSGGGFVGSQRTLSAGEGVPTALAVPIRGVLGAGRWGLAS